MSDVSVVIVTGAAGNLGRAVVALLAHRGASVVVADRNETSVSDVVEGLDDRARHLGVSTMNLGDAGNCEAIAASTLSRYGRIDGLVHTVGGFATASASDSDPALWETMFGLNALTTLNMFRAVLPPMRAARQGALVAIGAQPALRAPTQLSAYAASKAAVLRLVESFADELKAENIRCNAILPTVIDTPQNRAAMPDANFSTWVQPRQLATVIAFLLSEDSAAVTGVALPVTGRG